MTLFAILIISFLWLVSIFSFAKWRVSTVCKNAPGCSVLNDLVFKIYLKASGAAVFAWLCMMIARS